MVKICVIHYRYPELKIVFHLGEPHYLWVWGGEITEIAITLANRLILFLFLFDGVFSFGFSTNNVITDLS